jgi:hypothetical protein
VNANDPVEDASAKRMDAALENFVMALDLCVECVYVCLCVFMCVLVW